MKKLSGRVSWWFSCQRTNQRTTFKSPRTLTKVNNNFKEVFDDYLANGFWNRNVDYIEFLNTPDDKDEIEMIRKSIYTGKPMETN
jgi:molybdopterin-guanine dinucleotide biosynthesis protein